MAGSVVITLSKVDRSGTDPSGIRVLEFDWTASGSDGTLTNVTISDNQAKVLSGLKAVLGVTNPGATAPTAAYDIEILDEDGIDIFGTALKDRSATASEQARPAIATLAGERLVDGHLTFQLTNNSVHSALGTCKIYFTK